MLNGERQPIRMNDGKVFAKWTWLCLNSPYRDYFLRQMEELIANYEFEGLFLDIVLNHRALVCYNPCCSREVESAYTARRCRIPCPTANMHATSSSIR